MVDSLLKLLLIKDLTQLDQVVTLEEKMTRMIARKELQKGDLQIQRLREALGDMLMNLPSHL